MSCPPSGERVTHRRTPGIVAAVRHAGCGDNGVAGSHGRHDPLHETRVGKVVELGEADDIAVDRWLIPRPGAVQPKGLAFILTWIGALVAAVIVIDRTRPRIAALTGVTAATSVVGLSMHHAFYYQALADLAGIPDHDATARLFAQAGSDPLSVAGMLMFLIGALLTPIILGIGMWRSQSLPWWAAAGLLFWMGSVLIGSEATPAALANLALLLPFAALARELTATSRAAKRPRVVEAP
jgi:hypothetical protein